MKTSKYRQVTEWIQNRIASGELSAGDKLESENEMSQAFGISRQTIRHALGLLEQQGVLTRVQGSGTYVRGEDDGASEVSGLSKTVTIITTYADSYIFPRILQAIVGKLQEAGYSTRIMFTGNRIETERQLLKRLLEDGRRDPLIAEPVMSSLPNPNLKYYRRLQARGIPVLFFHSFYEELDCPHICIDDEQAGKTATEYLISQGHTKIAGIFKLDDGQGRRRYQGYLKALDRAGIELCEEHVCWIDTLEMKHLSGIRENLKARLRGCTACVCYNDEVAHALTEFARGEGIQIPQQMSLVSIDNSQLARLNSVPLTSVVHPMEALGTRTAEAILQLAEDPSKDVTYEFPVTIKVRDSVVPVSEE